MTQKKLRVEHGVIIGTASDKYDSGNFIARRLVRGFDQGIETLVRRTDPETITEIGCGEGHVTEILLRNTRASVRGFDISETIVKEAQQNVSSDRATFEQRNIYDVIPEQHQADLVVCCEVLEHLDDPRKGLDLLASLAKPYALLSVPREPIWCALNLMRGSYLRDLGNTPGHLQHWSRRGFLRFVGRRFDVLKTLAPLPWTMVLAKVK